MVLSISSMALTNLSLVSLKLRPKFSFHSFRSFSKFVMSMFWFRAATSSFF